MNNEFTEIVSVRFSKEQIKDIDRVIRRFSGLYPSRSLFVRAAALKLIRDKTAEAAAAREKRRRATFTKH